MIDVFELIDKKYKLGFILFRVTSIEKKSYLKKIMIMVFKNYYFHSLSLFFKYNMVINRN